MNFWRAALQWQSRAVVGRHLRVHVRHWHTAFLPPAAEPVVLLLAFGLGLGVHVSGIGIGDREVDYASYIAPGMLAYTAFLTPFFHALFASYIRMRFQRTWEGQLITQIALPHVVWGELLWAAMLGAIYVAIVSVAIVGCQLAGWLHIDLALLPVAVPLAFLTGIAFAAVALCFTAYLPTIDHMNLPVFLVALPLGFASNTYFPVPTGNPAVAALVNCNPLYHLAEGLRHLLLGGSAWPHFAASLGLCTLVVAIAAPIAHRRLRRRVLGEV